MMVKAVDLFAGFGGFTDGAKQAGVEVIEAHNHWKVAVDTHYRNHPGTKHVCQDLRQADWRRLARHDMICAAPACQGHSNASQPKRAIEPAFHDEVRATAWAVVDCVEVTRPKVVVVENVPKFLKWELYPLWWSALERLGYKLTANIIRASHCGVPQRRDRLIIIGSRRKAIHLEIPETAEPSFESVIDWSAGGWRPIKMAEEAAAARMQIAAKRFGTALVQHTSDHTGIPIDEPIRTITTKVQWCLVRNREYRWLTLREVARGMGFKDRYIWDPALSNSDVVKGFGNAICPPVARTVTSQVVAQM